MTYEEVVASIKKSYKDADAKELKGHIAIQINVTGEGGGALYIEVNDGKIDVQPYEYFDRNAIIYTPADAIIDIASGKLDIESAYNEKKIYIEGEVNAALLLKDIKFKKPAAKKTTATKKAATAKKTTTAKKATTTKKATTAKKEETTKKAKAEEKATATVAKTVATVAKEVTSAKKTTKK